MVTGAVTAATELNFEQDAEYETTFTTSIILQTESAAPGRSIPRYLFILASLLTGSLVLIICLIVTIILMARKCRARKRNTAVHVKEVSSSPDQLEAQDTFVTPYYSEIHSSDILRHSTNDSSSNQLELRSPSYAYTKEYNPICESPVYETGNSNDYNFHVSLNRAYGRGEEESNMKSNAAQSPLYNKYTECDTMCDNAMYGETGVSNDYTVHVGLNCAYGAGEQESLESNMKNNIAYTVSMEIQRNAAYTSSSSLNEN